MKILTALGAGAILGTYYCFIMGLVLLILFGVIQLFFIIANQFPYLSSISQKLIISVMLVWCVGFVVGFMSYLKSKSTQ